MLARSLAKNARLLRAPVARAALGRRPGGCDDCDCGAGSAKHVRFFGAGSDHSKVTDAVGVIPDEMEHATGLRREELEDFKVGIERFNRSGLRVEKKGTKEDPTLIPSMMESRVVGHFPFHGSGIRWFELRKGELTVVSAGSFFPNGGGGEVAGLSCTTCPVAHTLSHTQLLRLCFSPHPVLSYAVPREWPLFHAQL